MNERAWFIRHFCVYLQMASDFIRLARQHPEDAELCKRNARFWIAEAQKIPPVRLP